MALMFSPPCDEGMVAPDFALPGVDGKEYTLGDFAGARVLVVVCMCNHCPFVQQVLGRLAELSEVLMREGDALVGINSNDAVRYPEDSFEKMCALGVPYVYLRDETQEVARKYGAVCTPDFFVFDAERRLRYRGRLDDSANDAAKVTDQELLRAVREIRAGRRVAVQYPSSGCSIKWRA